MCTRDTATNPPLEEGPDTIAHLLELVADPIQRSMLLALADEPLDAAGLAQRSGEPLHAAEECLARLRRLGLAEPLEDAPTPGAFGLTARARIERKGFELEIRLEGADNALLELRMPW